MPKNESSPPEESADVPRDEVSGDRRLAPLASVESPAWLRARVLRVVLDGVARSSVRDEIVVRDSVVLERWFPDRARPAHHLDLVVRDGTYGPDFPEGELLRGDIEVAMGDALSAAGFQVLEEEIVILDLWSSERGDRVHYRVPWVSASGVRDVLRMDITYYEPIGEPPTLEALDASAGHYRAAVDPSQPSLWFASRADSLAWKLVCLETEHSPLASDLYDAVLLAEDTVLDLGLLRRAFLAKGVCWERGGNTDFIRRWPFHRIDWQPFAAQHPTLATGDAAQWGDRLARTLRLTRDARRG